MELIDKPLKILPFLLSAYITIRIYKCPCDKLMSCTKVSSLLALGALAAMTLGGYPLKI